MVYMVCIPSILSSPLKLNKNLITGSVDWTMDSNIDPAENP